MEPPLLIVWSLVLKDTSSDWRVIRYIIFWKNPTPDHHHLFLLLRYPTPSPTYIHYPIHPQPRLPLDTTCSSLFPASINNPTPAQPQKTSFPPLSPLPLLMNAKHLSYPQKPIPTPKIISWFRVSSVGRVGRCLGLMILDILYKHDIQCIK